jgi:biotin-(acetyl-CoA carboxylase) ligase
MPLETRSRVPTSWPPRLDLPPPFRLVMLREAGDAFAHAKAIAAAEGAGTLVHVGRFDLAEFAVVLEPEEPLRTARRALYVGLCALGDALAALAPPEKPISFDWPDAIWIDGGLVGGVRLGWPPAAEEDEPPAWLVFGGVIRMVAMGEGEPGVWPQAAALEQEGFEDPDPGRLVESFARHLMATVDGYRERGFGEVAKRYLLRLRPAAGLRRDIDQQGDLLVRRPGGEVERHSIIAALAAPSWLDPKTGGPRVKPLRHETIR